MANLDRYVVVQKGKDFVRPYKLVEVLAPHREEIQSIEIYSNPVMVEVNYGSLICSCHDIY